MNPQIKQAWIDALESGYYHQITGTLESVVLPNHFCCLGVLAKINPEICDSLGGIKTVPVNGKTVFGSGSLGKAFLATTPTDALDAFGLNRDLEQKLIDMNDEEGLSFPEIANWIKENL